MRGIAAYLIVALLLAFGAGAEAATLPIDEGVVDALAAGDAYVSPSTPIPSAATAQRQLSAHAAELARQGQPVKMALMPSYDGENAFAFAERLREEIDWDGTLVVATPSGPTGAAGPRQRDSMAAAFLAEGIDRIDNPTRRLLLAADLAVPPPPRGESGNQGLLVLIGLSLLGGGWAIGWGLRREQRRARAALNESRAALRVNLDALRARAVGLGSRPSLSDELRAVVDGAIADHGAGDAALTRAVAAADLDGVVAHLSDGLAKLEHVGQMLGEPQPASDPFAGLCSADPAHGPAIASARLSDRDVSVPVCAACRDAAASGSPSVRRRIPVGGASVPFDEGRLILESVAEE